MITGIQSDAQTVVRARPGPVTAAIAPIARSVAVLTMLIAFVASAGAGSLEDAPYRLTLPEDWRFEGTEPVAASSNLVRVAYATNATELRTVAIRHQLQGVSEGALEQFVGDARALLASNNVPVIETKTNFVGQPARLLTYEMKIGSEEFYTETMMMVVGDAGWMIAGMGPAGREAEISQILTYYSKK